MGVTQLGKRTVHPSDHDPRDEEDVKYIENEIVLRLVEIQQLHSSDEKGYQPPARVYKVSEDWFQKMKKVMASGAKGTVWEDKMCKEKNGIVLRILEIQQLEALAVKCYNALYRGVSDRTIGDIMVLAWNLKAVRNSTARVFDVPGFYFPCEGGSPDVEVETLSDIVDDCRVAVQPPRLLVRTNFTTSMCYMAASLLRLFTKPPGNYALAYEHIRKGYYEFYDEDTCIPAKVFNKACLETIHAAFNQNPLFKNTLGRFLYNHVLLGVNTSLCVFLYEQHVRMTGLHAIPLIAQAATKLNRDREDIMAACWHRVTKDALVAISNVLVDQVAGVNGSPAHKDFRQTWMYSRIYDPKYYSAIQTNDNQMLVGILAYTNLELDCTATSVLKIRVVDVIGDSSRRFWKAWAKNIVACLRNLNNKRKANMDN